MSIFKDSSSRGRGENKENNPIRHLNY
jgi:hypothetical protein